MVVLLSIKEPTIGRMRVKANKTIATSPKGIPWLKAMYITNKADIVPTGTKNKPIHVLRV